jgi:hypothetical protein
LNEPAPNGVAKAHSVPGLGQSRDLRTYPIFDEIFRPIIHEGRVGDLQAITVPIKPEERKETIDCLTWALEPNRFSTPGLLSRRLNDIIGLVSVPVAWLGLVGMAVGIYGFAEIALKVFFHYNTPAFLTEGGRLRGIFLAYSLGFVARHGITQWLQLARSPAVTKEIPIFSIVGLCYLISLQAEMTGLLQLAWAGLSVSLGWWIRAYATATAARSAPHLFRTEELVEPGGPSAGGNRDLPILLEARKRHLKAREMFNRRLKAREMFNHGKAIYDRYVQIYGIDYEKLTPEQSSHANRDQGLRESEEIYLEALQECVTHDEQFNRAACHAQLGLLKQIQGNLVDAKSHYCSALRILNALPTQALPQLAKQIPMTEAICHFHLGLMFLLGGERQPAKVSFERARRASDYANYAIGVFNASRMLKKCD